MKLLLGIYLGIGILVAINNAPDVFWNTIGYLIGLLIFIFIWPLGL